MKTVLVAIGGNALFDVESGNNIDPMKLQVVCRQLVNIIQLDYQPVITFGNGPQVGNLLEMSERYMLPPKWPVPLDVCVAWTQAEIGYTLMKELHNQLHEYGLERTILGLNTTVIVDRDDPAFINATKFVGNFFTEPQAELLSEERGWQMKADSNRGFRRVVPSPLPLEIVEEEAIRSLLATGCIVLCGGGGGIPVIIEDGALRGVEAVIDKDFTACLLASRLGIDELVICTGVDYLYVDFGTPTQRALFEVSTAEARQYLAEGQFPPGSMGPKVDAMVQFIERGGQRATLTQLHQMTSALQGLAGTHFTS